MWTYISLLHVFIFFFLWNPLLVIGSVIKWVRRGSFSLLRRLLFHFPLSSSKTLMGGEDFVQTLSLVESFFFLLLFCFIIILFHFYFFLGLKTRSFLIYISMGYDVIFHFITHIHC